MPSHRVGGHKQAQDDHQTRQAEAQSSQAAMQADAASGRERGLYDQQKDPAGKHGAMNMNEQVGKWSFDTPAR
jgi:hypothetical protein